MTTHRTLPTLCSPVDRAELKVRLGRLDSDSPAMADQDIIRSRDLELNTATYQATVGGEPRDLTFMEYELLRFLVENPGLVWSLRAKLGEERSSWISTVRSVGYRFGQRDRLAVVLYSQSIF